MQEHTRLHTWAQKVLQYGTRYEIARHPVTGVEYWRPTPRGPFVAIGQHIEFTQMSFSI